MNCAAVSLEKPNPIDLLFAGMDKLGPGDDAHTLYVLRSLPRNRSEVVVDAGCGVGRQTLVLAKELKIDIHAVDSYQPFLDRLEERAEESGIAHFVHAHCIDMKDIPSAFPKIDLLWSEGAAYNIGFANALTTWAEAITPDGFGVVSELCWLREQIPERVKEFFQSGYPDMKSVPENIAIAEQAGYKIFNIYTLPENAWTENYYDILAPRAKSLLNHSDASVSEFALETIKEIDAFSSAGGTYGYVFFVLQRKFLKSNETPHRQTKLPRPAHRDLSRARLGESEGVVFQRSWLPTVF
jgi:SAM-dependent methyltransferase